MLGTVLGAIHNMRFYQRLMTDAREAIVEGRYPSFKRSFLEEYVGASP